MSDKPKLNIILDSRNSFVNGDYRIDTLPIGDKPEDTLLNDWVGFLEVLELINKFNLNVFYLVPKKHNSKLVSSLFGKLKNKVELIIEKDLVLKSNAVLYVGLNHVFDVEFFGKLVKKITAKKNFVVTSKELDWETPSVFYKEKDNIVFKKEIKDNVLSMLLKVPEADVLNYNNIVYFNDKKFFKNKSVNLDELVNLKIDFLECESMSIKSIDEYRDYIGEFMDSKKVEILISTITS